VTEQILANASATRGFFVDMLVRDISVDGAILDLIDNAVDAALNQSTKDNLEGYRIEVDISTDRFTIQDNCGGISIDTARNYAFRFGRPQGFTPQTQIGQFGIGMKRGIFRLGKNFKVDSSTDTTRFIVSVDVDQWRESEGEQWTFPMSIEDELHSEAGTIVEVRNLHSHVAQLFSQEYYPNRMRNEVKERYGQLSKKGLEIVLNKEPANMPPYELLSGSGISPEHHEYTRESEGHPVNVRIIAGIGPPRRPVTESGWYVYCNGRLVVKADRTELTGWGTNDPDGEDGPPAWHPQYNRFRGFVFFSSAHPSALPWTTTKTEIDKTANVYRNALQRMQSIIKQYASFTNNLKLEYEQDGPTAQPIQDALANASLTKVSSIGQGKFTVPDRSKTTPIPSTPESSKTTSIQFHVEKSRVDKVKKALNLATNRQVGERAFDRLYKEEIGEE